MNENHDERGRFTSGGGGGLRPLNVKDQSSRKAIAYSMKHGFAPKTSTSETKFTNKPITPKQFAKKFPKLEKQRQANAAAFDQKYGKMK